MKIKKFLSLILAVTFVLGMFANIPVSAAAPEEKIEIVLPAEYSRLWLVEGETDLYEVKKDNLWGFFSLKKGWVTECKWYGIHETDIPGFHKVYGDNGCGIIDRYGNEIIPATWDELWINSGIVITHKNGYCGMMDINGNVLAEPIYDGVDIFVDGIAKIYKDEKVGFINTAGRIISEPVWADAQDFSESLAAVKNDEGLWGYIDINGNTVIPCKYDNASSFNEGMASVLIDDTVYLIDTDGKFKLLNGKPLALEPETDCLGYIVTLEFYGSKKDVACVKLKGEENYCYIDNKCNLITESVYKYNVPFTDEDYAITVIPNRFGMEKYALLTINRVNGIKIETLLSNKNLIKKVEFGETTFFDADNRLYDMDGNDLFGMEFEKYIYHYDNSDIINAVYKGQYVCVSFSGEVISPLSDYQFYYVKENLYMATADDGRVKLCDRSGNQIAATDEYEEAYVSDGVIYIKDTDEKWGVCGTDGVVIIEPRFDEVYGISEGMLKYKSKGKYGFVNMETNEIIKPKFTRAGIFVDGYCWVSEKVLIGAIDKEGDFIIDQLYWGHDDCTGFGGNEFVYKVTSVQKGKNGKYGVINDKGEKLTDFSYNYISAFNGDGVAEFSVYDENAEFGFLYGLMRVVHNDSEELPEQITADKSEIVTYVGCHDIITETVTPITAANLGVAYTSTNPKVATVDKVGRVYGVSEGNAIIVVVSQADPSIVAAVNVRVEDRTLHKETDIIPEACWEEQTWLSDVVIARLAELGITKTAEQLTYGDLLEVYKIEIYEWPDTEPDKVYHFPSIIGEFSNLMSIHIAPRIFAPLISKLPDSAKFLSNLDLENTYIYGTYDEEVNEAIIRNNANGIPDENLYCSLSHNDPAMVHRNAFNTNLQYESITNLKGLSLLNFEYYSDLDLSYNNITDISELALMNFYGTIDLRYNKIDLSDKKTIAVIEQLEEKGCTVLTENQNESAIMFYDYWDNLTEEVPEIKATAYEDFEAEYNVVKFAVHPYDSMADMSIISENNSIATPYIETDRNYENRYLLYCNPEGVGKTSFYFIKKSNDKIIQSIPVKISDPRFFVEDIEVSYYIDEWYPFSAHLQCENHWSDLQFRKKGYTEWITYVYDNITENGVYEVRYQGYNGKYSNIAELNITGIREIITEKQMPDENLRNCFDAIYEGYKLDYLDGICCNISNLKGLSLLDFSEIDSLNFRYNYITDISELAKLNIKDIDIYLEYNRIDFTLPNNAKALRTLYEKGCTVYCSNQFIDEVVFSDTEWYYDFYLGQDYYIGSSLHVYNVENLNDISLRTRSNSTIYNLEYYVNRGYINFEFNFLHKQELEYIDVYYQGKLIGTLTFNMWFEGGMEGTLEEPQISVSYGQGSGPTGTSFQGNFQNGGELYEYRKQGDTEWIVSDWSRYEIYQEGTYEFRYMRNGVYSPIATIELKYRYNNGMTMILENGGWKVSYYNNSLESIEIPEEVEGYPVTNISAISYCRDLKNIFIPKTVKSIGNIYGCENLEKITISDENPYYYAVDNMIIEKEENSLVLISPNLSGTLVVPNVVKKISDSLNNNNITKIVIPSSVTYLSAHSFNNLHSLKEIEISADNPYYYVIDNMIIDKEDDTLIWISPSVGETLVIPNCVKELPHSYIYGGIKKVVIPASVTNLSASIFSYFESIEEIEISADNPRYYAEDGAVFEKYTGTLVYFPRKTTGSYSIPEGTLFIGYEAFRYSNLETVTIPSSVLHVNDSAFAHSKIKSANISYGVLKINYDAFYYCENLEEIILPSSVTSIGYYAFHHCHSLKKISIPASVTYIGDESIPQSAVIYCASGSVAHNYAMENELEYVLVSTGDSNYDGTVSALDFVALKKLLFVEKEYNEAEIDLIDTNADGAVDILDIIRLKNYLLGDDVPLGNQNGESNEEFALPQTAYSKQKTW